MNIVTSYFLVRQLPGTLALGGDVRRNRTSRQQEYMDCLANNQRHPGVESIHLVVEGAAAYQHFLDHHRPCSGGAPILPLVHLSSSMPTYQTFFTLANQMLRGRLTMVCNADVYLSHRCFDVKRVAELFAAQEAVQINAGEGRAKCRSSAEVPAREQAAAAAPLALALTRHESDDAFDAPLITDYRGSHDAFVLKPPLSPSFLGGVSHYQNCYKAENIVIHELRKAGYVVLNPSLDLRLVHRHSVDLRQWFPPVDEERYGRADPITTAEALSQIQESKADYLTTNHAIGPE